MDNIAEQLDNSQLINSDDTTPLAIAKGKELVQGENEPQTIVEGFQQALEKYPDGKFIYIHGEGEEEEQTYQETWERAHSILAKLQKQGISPGTKVILQLENSLDFISCFWSCLLGGLVPILTPVVLDSSLSSSKGKNEVLTQFLPDLVPFYIITTENNISKIKKILELNDCDRIIAIDTPEIESQKVQYHSQKPEDLAYIIFSSGTTGKPKLITMKIGTFIYRNFSRLKKSQNKKLLNTVNLFPLHSGLGNPYMMINDVIKIHIELDTFIKNPLIFLDTIEKNQVNMSVLTNFIAITLIEALQNESHRTWDLSMIKIIGIGTETINYQIISSLLNKLAPYGLKSEVIKPIYGMSELGTITIAKELVLKTSADAGTFVEVGKPRSGVSVRIVDDQNRLLHEKQIGRIQVIGSSMTSGYYQNPQGNENLFTSDGWMNTGDLGFLENGSLTITGREKEIIIINGAKYPCSMIEILAEEVDGVSQGYTSACGVRTKDSITEELAIFFHTPLSETKDLAVICQNIRIKIVKGLSINPTYLIPLSKEAIPLTITGKIQRFKLKQSFEDGEFQDIVKSVAQILEQELAKNFTAPRNLTEEMLAQIWLDVLSLESKNRNQTNLDIYANFFDLGGHSLAIPSLITKIKQVFSIELPVRQLFETSTIAQLAECIDRHKQDKNHKFSVIEDQFSYLVPLQVNGDKPNFFLVPGGSGGIPELQIYAKLVYLLGQDQPVYGFQATGLQQKGKKSITIAELASKYIQEMRILQPTGPYVVGGECIGGLLALEIARQIHSQGDQVQLVLIDSESLQDLTLWQKLDRQLHSRFNLIHHRKQLRQRTFTQKLVYLFDKTIGNFDQLPTKLNDENKIRASNYTNMLLKYIPKTYPGNASLIMTSSSVRRSIPLGWQKIITGELTIYEVPGNHYSYLGEYVADTAKQLKSCLDELY